MTRSNRETIARLGGVEVATLPPLPDGSPGSLAAGGAALPLDAWLARRVSGSPPGALAVVLPAHRRARAALRPLAPRPLAGAYGPPTSRHIAGRGSSACGGRGLASCSVPSGRCGGTPTLTTAHWPGVSSRGSHECVARSACSRASRPHSAIASSRVMSRAYARARSAPGYTMISARRRARRAARLLGLATSASRRWSRSRSSSGLESRVRAPLARHDDAGRGDARDARRGRRASRGRASTRRLRAVPGAALPLDDAVATAATGDIWLFRGRSLADRAIQTVTNSPVNHVGMVVALDDLPPLLWHAELGRIAAGRLERQAPARRAAAPARPGGAAPGASATASAPGRASSRARSSASTRTG